MSSANFGHILIVTFLILLAYAGFLSYRSINPEILHQLESIPLVLPTPKPISSPTLSPLTSPSASPSATPRE
jgi:hypothetical protein